MHSARGIEFGEDYRLDPVRRHLWCGPERVRLGPTAFALLRYLVERPDQVVSKRELLTAIWPSGGVSDAVLKTCVAEVRRTLEHRPGGGGLIETRHRRGYRFVGPNEVATSDSAMTLSRR